MFSLLISLLVLFLLDLFLGSVHVPLKSVINILVGIEGEKESWEIIILNNRLPKALAAILCGAALSVSGLQMQTLFRNPLAGPYILGISAGSGLGVAIFIMGLSMFGITYLLQYQNKNWINQLHNNSAVFDKTYKIHNFQMT